MRQLTEYDFENLKNKTFLAYNHSVIVNDPHFDYGLLIKRSVINYFSYRFGTRKISDYGFEWTISDFTNYYEMTEEEFLLKRLEF